MPQYGPRMDSTIAALIAQQGENAARGAAASGAIWGRAVEQLGGIAAGAVQQHQENQIRKKREEAFQGALQTWDPTDPQGSTLRLAKVVGPEDAMKFGAGLLSFQSMMEKNKKAEIPTLEELKAGVVAARVLSRNAPEMFAQQYPNLRAQFGPAFKAHLGYELPEAPTPEVMQGLDALAKEWGKSGEEYTLPPGAKRFGAGGTLVAENPATVKPEKTLAEIEAEAAARARGTRAGNPPAPPAPPEEMVLSPEGVVLTSYGVKQKAEARRQAMERGIPVFENATTQVKGVTLAGIAADAQELARLLQKDSVKAAIGPVAGRWNQLKAKVVDLDPDAQRAIQLMTSLSDTELRKRSGAQINDKEMQRLLRFTTDPNRPMGHNITAVKGLLKSAGRDYQALSSKGLIPEPKTKAEMDALPSGTLFIDPEDEIRIKP